VVLKTKENVIYVDFVFESILKAVETWYKEVIPMEMHNMDSYIFFLKRRYDDDRFKNHATIGPERDKFLEEIDLEFQARRWD
jgi:hypothetical protein